MYYIVEKGTISRKDCFAFLRSIKETGSFKYSCYGYYTQLYISPVSHLTEYISFTKDNSEILPIKHTSKSMDACKFLMNLNKDNSLYFPETFENSIQYLKNYKTIDGIMPSVQYNFKF